MVYKAIYGVIQCTVLVDLLQISMNATQTMEAVHRTVPTHQDLECVAAGVDTR